MSRDYSEYSTDDLLQALEWSGRHPDVELIEACMERQDEITPGLLDMLASPDEDEVWMDDDPRWYRYVHAGKLLIHFQEPKALPVFGEILRDPESDVLLEWFDTDLHALGPDAVPMLINIFTDPSAFDFGRSLSISAAGQIAREHPEERERVVDALRGELPPVSDDGEPIIEGEIFYDDVEHWSWVTLELAELRDEQSRDRVEALYEADLIDTFMIGPLEDYHAYLNGDITPRDYEFDLLGYYDSFNSREQSRFLSEPTPEGRLSEMLEQAGRHPDPDLIRTCIRHQEELTPKLLDILLDDVGEQTPEQRWEEDDPRQYRMIHAGLLLIHFREEDALPLLAEAFRNRKPGSFSDRFVNKLYLYGPPAVPALIDVLHDEEASVWGRIEAVGELSRIAWENPYSYERVVEALRDILPPLLDDGSPDVAGTVDQDDPILWANVAYELARLEDEESRPQIESLFEHDLMDRAVFGDLDAYRRILRGEGESWTEFKHVSFDVIEHYEDQYRWAQEEAERRVEREREDEQSEQERWWEQSAQDRQQQEARGTQASKGGHYEGSTFVRDEPKVGRNDPCPCGSGRKYKHCCG